MESGRSGPLSGSKSLRGPRWREFHCLAVLAPYINTWLVGRLCRRVIQVPSSGITLLFCDLRPQIESHMQENKLKNAVGPNEFTDFEKFEVKHPNEPKTMFGTNWLNHPGSGITLRQNRATSHIITCDANATNNEIHINEGNSLKIINSDLTSVNIS